MDIIRKIMNSIMGTASQTSIEDVKEQVNHVLIVDEQVEYAYRTVRDLIVFTNKRLLIVNVQGVSGKRVDYFTVPYRSISHFSVETASTLEYGTDLYVWIKGQSEAIKQSFHKSDSIFDIQKVLAGYTL